MFSFFVRLLLLSLCLLLLSASNTWQGSNEDSNYPLSQQRSFIEAMHGDAFQLNEIVRRAFTEQDMYWLQQGAELGHVDALYKLSVLAKSDEQRIKWLSLAAQEGLPQAQFELSLLPSQKQNRLTLLQDSANQDYLPAQHALANWLLLNQKESAATLWLEKSAVYYAQDAFSLANIRWREKQVPQARDWFEVAAELGHQQSRHYLDVVLNQDSFDLASANKSVVAFDDSFKRTRNGGCAKHVLPISLSLGNQVQAEKIVEQFNADDRFKSIPICLSKPLWLKGEEGLCHQQLIANRNRTVCDIHRLEALIRNNNITHLILFQPDGRAYVNAGVMYLNALASYSLFVHELAHFAGFADEYPMGDTLAEIHCTAQTAPNLLFDGELAYAPNARLEHWQELKNQDSKSTGLTVHRARTCNNVSKNAYKITNERTFLEFHDTDNIPAEYLAMWRKQVVQKIHWYPVSINLARYYEKLNDASKAATWRDFAQQQLSLGKVKTILLPEVINPH